jgi:single-stranded DNA-binding protein
MFNTCILVGRIIDDSSSEEGKAMTHVIIETDRPFREATGKMESDRFYVSLWKGAAQQCHELCHPGDIVAIRGRMISKVEMKDNVPFYTCQLVGENVSFPHHVMN